MPPKYYTQAHAKYVRDYRQRLRDQFIAAYGGACQCCGETNPRFLTLDHAGAGGVRERNRTEGRGNTAYVKARAEGFPPTYMLMCFNCNMGRGMNNGVCPHTEA